MNQFVPDQLTYARHHRRSARRLRFLEFSRPTSATRVPVVDDLDNLVLALGLKAA